MDIGLSAKFSLNYKFKIQALALCAFAVAKTSIASLLVEKLL